MRQAGVDDYAKFATEALQLVRDLPISFEVFADEFSEMEEQALEIASWGRNVYVKIPVSNTRGEPSYSLIRRLSQAGVPLNVTAVFTLEQVREVMGCLRDTTPTIVSVFAGRIADAGSDPLTIMQQALELILPHSNVELLWASPREIFNLVQADQLGCHIITLSNDLLKKIPLLGKDLTQFSRETVAMFYRDAMAANYSIPIPARKG
jgi:transaldolase